MDCYVLHQQTCKYCEARKDTEICCHSMEVRMLTVKFEDVLREMLSGLHTYIDCAVILYSIIARIYE